MNTWECEECGATATDQQRKTAIHDACDQRCKWVSNTQTLEDDEDDETPENSQ
jgi:hypothetical protein